MFTIGLEIIAKLVRETCLIHNPQIVLSFAYYFGRYGVRKQLDF